MKNNRDRIYRVTFLGFLVVIFISCHVISRLNIFSVEDDIRMGQEITNQILNNPDDYPVLDKNEYSEAYEHLYRIRDSILASGELQYADQFDWDVYIIDEDVLNAFSLPGGNTFYYTGLIEYLDDEASFAGVMAHEFAHSDLRHSTTRLTQIYGYQVILSMLMGEDPSLAAEIAADLALGLTTLAYSRGDEYEADEHAVKYIYSTSWDSRGIARFFEKMELEDGEDWMVYFSTHPHPNDRIDRIYEHWENLGGEKGNNYKDRYQAFKESLP